ncbi:MAG: chemotaxis protein CheW [Isosphaeraceae bacterium]|nr:chemotaxis protein CheW [Isosphaeraceae bacterium]
MTTYLSQSHSSTRSRPWCCFRSGARSYAVDLRAVVEVIETEGLVRLPHSPKGILGLCAFRRDVIPVVRLGAGSEADAAPRERIDVLILRTEQGFWGLRIDRSGTTVTEDFLEEETALDDDPSAAPPVLIGSLRRGDTVFSVIDPEPTWQRLRTAVERDLRIPLAPPTGVAPALSERVHNGTGGAG